jgi:CO/xanthine dehydrogenase FAD-binding subunit
MRRSAMPSAPAVGARTRGTDLNRMHPATADHRLAGSRLTPDAIDAAADAANDAITFMGNPFGSAAYPAELLPIYVSRALSQIATPPNPSE